MIASAIVRLPSVEMTFLQPCFLVSFLGVLFFPAALVAASSGGSEDSLVPRELKMVFDNCMARTSPGYCLQKKMLDFLDRALTKEQIPLAEGFSLSKTNDANYTETATARQSTGSIEEQIWSKLDRFFNTRSLSISLAEEGRGKKKKEHALYVVAMATALAVLIPLTLKGIALIAGKALLLAKLALVLAGLAALKHFTHHEESHRRVHIADDVHDAHSLAYGAYAPAHAAAV